MPYQDLSVGKTAKRPTLSFPGVPKSDTSGVNLSYGNKAPSGGSGSFFDTSWIGSALGLSYGTPANSGPSFEQTGRNPTVTTGSIDGSSGFSDLLKAGVGGILQNMGAKSDQPQTVPVAYTQEGSEGSSMLPIILLGGAALIAGTYFLAR